MEVLKLIPLDSFFSASVVFIDSSFKIHEVFSPTYLNSFFLLSIFNSVKFVQNTTLIFTVKFVVSIMFLILIRGGTPRYRYDYLTKLGWLKFLGLIVVFFLSTILFYFIL